MEYLTILLSIFLVFFTLKHMCKIRLFASTREMLTFLACVLIVGLVWDSYGILRGHWTFGEPFLVGIKIGWLPIEEILFILIVPFSILVLYKIVTRKTSK